jgi:hypothetical protein
LKTDKQGLGAVNQTQQPQISVKEKRRLEIIEKTRRRFDEVCFCCCHPFSNQFDYLGRTAT